MDEEKLLTCLSDDRDSAIEETQTPDSEELMNIDVVHEKDPGLILCENYVEDIIKYLIQREKQRKLISFKSSKLICRKNLLKIVQLCGENCALERTTVHLAVHLLDVFSDSHKINPNKLTDVAFACVVLAAKIEENEQNIPKLSELNFFMNSKVNKSDLKIAEFKVIDFFDWSITYPTAATFIDYFAYKIVDEEDFIYFENNLNKYKYVISYKNLMEMTYSALSMAIEILDSTLEDLRLTHLTPSRLAAACLGAARDILNIYPIWTERLKNLTTYNYELLEEYIKTLIDYQDEYIKRHSLTISVKTAIDSGMESDIYMSSDNETDEDVQPNIKKARCLYAK